MFVESPLTNLDYFLKYNVCGCIRKEWGAKSNEKPFIIMNIDNKSWRKKERTWSILLTLLAPKTLCTFANFWGSSAGKYGAKTQSWAHLLLRSLHAAQGEAAPCFLPPPSFINSTCNHSSKLIFSSLSKKLNGGKKRSVGTKEWLIRHNTDSNGKWWMEEGKYFESEQKWETKKEWDMWERGVARII